MLANSHSAVKDGACLLAGSLHHCVRAGAALPAGSGGASYRPPIASEEEASLVADDGWLSVRERQGTPSPEHINAPMRVLCSTPHTTRDSLASLAKSTTRAWDRMHDSRHGNNAVVRGRAQVASYDAFS